jgi:AcrR family transcriptional regulator
MGTRDRILESAEVLFATNGYDGTSLRDITEQAGANVAAVNYHFGSKENLLTALLDRVVVPINRGRLDLLEKASAEGPPDLEETLTAFLLPDLHSLETLRNRNPDLPRFVSRMYSENSPLMREVMGAQFTEIGQKFGVALARVLPDLGTDEIAFRLSCVVGIVVYMFAGVEAPGVAPLAAGDAQTDLPRLLAVARSIMTAPVREVVPT